MKAIFPDTIPIMALLRFANEHGLEVRKNGEDLEFQEKAGSNVRQFPRNVIKRQPEFDGPSVA